MYRYLQLFVAYEKMNFFHTDEFRKLEVIFICLFNRRFLQSNLLQWLQAFLLSDIKRSGLIKIFFLIIYLFEDVFKCTFDLSKFENFCNKIINIIESIFNGFLKRFLGVSRCVTEGAIHQGVQVDKCEEFSEISRWEERLGRLGIFCCFQLCCSQ